MGYKTTQMMKKFGAAAFTACVAVATHPVFAAVDADTTKQLGDAKTDVATIGAAGLGIIIVIAVYKYMKRGV